MNELLLVELTFNSKKWYLSEEGYIGENYYAPYISDTPSLELGEVKGGYIGVRLGELSIANRPNDRFSPFSIFGGGYAKLMANPNQKIPVQIYWQQNKIIESLFDGSMYLSGFNSDNFSFLLEDKIADVDLLSTARDFNSDFVSVNSISITGEGSSALVSAPDHGLKDGDFLRLSECPLTTAFETYSSSKNEIIPVRMTLVDDNFFRYDLINGTSTDFRRSFEYTLETYTQKPQPFSFGVVTRKKDIIQIDEKERDSLGDTSGDEFSNPNLKIDDPLHPLELYDDGVLVGTTDQSIFSNLITGIQATSIIKNGDYAEISTGNAQTPGSVPHQLKAGSTIGLEGFTPDGINTVGKPFHIVADIIDDYTFKIYLRLSADETLGLGTNPTIKTPGEYFGDDRLPTETTIFSRAAFNELPTYNASDSSTIRTVGGVDYTSFDGTLIYGTALVSGISSNGETLSDFFEYIANKIEVTNVDFSEAPDASTTKLQLWTTSQTKAVEYAGEIAYASNHLFEIKNDTVRVIDRAYLPEKYIELNNWEITESSYKMPTPVKALRVKWTENVVNPKTIPNSLSTREESVMISNMESGEITDVTPVSENSVDISNLLTKIRDTINKNIVEITIGRIRSDIRVGSRVKANRDEDGISFDMVVRTITYEFGSMNTKIVGDGVLSVIEQNQIY